MFIPLINQPSLASLSSCISPPDDNYAENLNIIASDSEIEVMQNYALPKDSSEIDAVDNVYSYAPILTIADTSEEDQAAKKYLSQNQLTHKPQLKIIAKKYQPKPTIGRLPQFLLLDNSRRIK